MKVVVYGVTKEFVSGQGTLRALGGINLEVRDREFFGIIGPTGCGKTTLLHIIAGLEKQSTGSVEFVGEKHGKSIVSMVFQESALMPWRNVEDNVPLGAEFRQEERSVYKRISRFFLDVVKLLDFAQAQPHELSGGMKQKVAIARALANDPEVILMDEPFGPLDAQTRLVLQDELLRVWDENKKTILFVTHDLTEAIALSDRVVLFTGRPGTVKRIFDVPLPRPRNVFEIHKEKGFTDIYHEIWQSFRSEIKV